MGANRERQASAEIEVTPEMIEAGADYLWGVLGEEGEGLGYYRHVAQKCFKIMLQARLSEAER